MDVDGLALINCLYEIEQPAEEASVAVLNMGNAYRPFPLQGFTFKPVTGIIGPNEPIIIPKEISDFGAVWEIEIGIIIGKKGRRIPNNETAYDYIYGYTIYNDITDYGKQIDGTFGSKLHDTFCPIGPCIVTRDEIDDPHNLIKRSWVNKQLASERSTREMFHKIPEFVSLPSQTLTLLPGTIISTGASDSGRIKDGDIIEFEITKIGRIRNPVVTEK
jgi:2-keto-4-pentenoate hydratase/2-oxohepta-3-ene-1,7-dioic acid hydratase in catechol pathway